MPALELEAFSLSRSEVLCKGRLQELEIDTEKWLSQAGLGVFQSRNVESVSRLNQPNYHIHIDDDFTHFCL